VFGFKLDRKTGFAVSAVVYASLETQTVSGNFFR